VKRRMKQVKKVKEVKAIEKMSEQEKDNEELYIKTVELKNRKEKIDELNKNIKLILEKKTTDLKRFNLLIEEKKIVGKYGNDATYLNTIDEYKDLLKRMTEFEVGEILKKVEETNNRVEDFINEQRDNIKSYEEEIEIIESRVKELEKSGAKLDREVPEGTFLTVQE